MVHVTLSVPWHARVPVSSPFCWFSRGLSHLVPYVCPLKRGTQEVPAYAPKTAKQQCTFDFSLHNNSGCDNTNYKSKKSVDQFWQKRAKYIRAYSTNRSADAKQKESSYKRAYKAKKTLKPKKKGL